MASFEGLTEACSSLTHTHMGISPKPPMAPHLESVDMAKNVILVIVGIQPPMNICDSFLCFLSPITKHLSERCPFSFSTWHFRYGLIVASISLVRQETLWIYPHRTLFSISLLGFGYVLSCCLKPGSHSLLIQNSQKFPFVLFHQRVLILGRIPVFHFVSSRHSTFS